MKIKDDQLYLTYMVKVGDTTFKPRIAVDDVEQADLIRETKLALASKNNNKIKGDKKESPSIYLHFKVVKGPKNILVKDYNYPDRPRLFIDDAVGKEHNKGQGPTR